MGKALSVIQNGNNVDIILTKVTLFDMKSAGLGGRTSRRCIGVR